MISIITDYFHTSFSCKQILPGIYFEYSKLIPNEILFKIQMDKYIENHLFQSEDTITRFVKLIENKFNLRVEEEWIDFESFKVKFECHEWKPNIGHLLLFTNPFDSDGNIKKFTDIELKNWANKYAITIVEKYTNKELFYKQFIDHLSDSIFDTLNLKNNSDHAYVWLITTGIPNQGYYEGYIMCACTSDENYKIS